MDKLKKIQLNNKQALETLVENSGNIGKKPFLRFFNREKRPIFLGALSIIIEGVSKNAVRLWPPKKKNKSFDTK